MLFGVHMWPWVAKSCAFLGAVHLWRMPGHPAKPGGLLATRNEGAPEERTVGVGAVGGVCMTLILLGNLYICMTLIQTYSGFL